MSDMRGHAVLTAKLRALQAALITACKTATEQVSVIAAADARALAPASQFTQAQGLPLKGSITSAAAYTDNAYVGFVRSTSDHALYVEFGTGTVGAASHAGVSPHVAVSYTAREKWTYAVENNAGDTLFFTTSGMPARPFMYPAAVQNKKRYATLMRNAASAALRRCAR